MKKLGRYFFDLCVFGVLAYLLAKSIGSGEVRIWNAVASYIDNPILYGVGVIFLFAVLVIWATLLGMQATHAIDKKVKEFGGNYDRNTFREILKSGFGKRN